MAWHLFMKAKFAWVPNMMIKIIHQQGTGSCQGLLRSLCASSSFSSSAFMSARQQPSTGGSELSSAAPELTLQLQILLQLWGRGLHIIAWLAIKK